MLSIQSQKLKNFEVKPSKSLAFYTENEKFSTGLILIFSQVGWNPSGVSPNTVIGLLQI